MTTDPSPPQGRSACKTRPQEWHDEVDEPFRDPIPTDLFEHDVGEAELESTFAEILSELQKYHSSP